MGPGKLVLTTILWFVPFVAAGIYTFSGAHDVAYSVTIPSSTATSGSGALYFQIVAKSTYQWVALGQGSQMARANMFVVYAASPNDITLSPRLGTGEVEPKFNPQARVSLLEGSGISNGYMTANVRCESCLEWSGGSLDLTNPSSDWIWAVKKGSPLNATSRSASIHEHDIHGLQSIDLTKAIISSHNVTNPFLRHDVGAAMATSGGGGSSSSTAALIAHGFLMAFAFVILFPSFALALHVVPYSKSVIRIHAPAQIFASCVALAGLGLGVYLGVMGGQMKMYHPIIGLIVVGTLLLTQPLMGVLQHLHYRRKGEKAWFAYLHRWLGRIMILLGIVNGGLGFMLAGIGTPGVPTSAVIAYSVIAGVVTLMYIATITIRTVRSEPSPKG